MDLSRVINFAADAHEGQRYGGKPYTYHLLKVAQVAKRYGGNDIAVAVAMLHDTLEDTAVTKEELAKEFGAGIADIVDLLSNTASKEETWKRIRSNKLATFVKLCDRIANVSEGGKVAMYKKQYPIFKKTLYKKGEFDKMWKELDELHK